jgi:hypothetical protein
MKALRVAALGLVVAACLAAAAAPVAAGEEGGRPARVAAGGAAGWIAGWVERVAAWLGWGEGEELRKATAAATSSCIDPSGERAPCPPGGGPVPSTDGDTGSCVDPDGNRVPCAP